MTIICNWLRRPAIRLGVGAFVGLGAIVGLIAAAVASVRDMLGDTAAVLFALGATAPLIVLGAVILHLFMSTGEPRR